MNTAHAQTHMKRFNHLISETESVYHEMARRFHLSDSVMLILYTLCDADTPFSCSLSEIRYHTGMGKQTLNSALRKLEAEGIVSLEQSGAKYKRVNLTAAGRELAGRTVVQIIQAENSILDAWTPEDVKAYLSLTERFLIALKEKARILG